MGLWKFDKESWLRMSDDIIQEQDVPMEEDIPTEDLDLYQEEEIEEEGDEGIYFEED